MKMILAALMFLGVSSQAHASLFSCEFIIENAVQAELNKRSLNDEITQISIVDDQSFSNLQTYRVITQKPELKGGYGMMYAAHWMVVVKNDGSSAGCMSPIVLHDITAL